MSKEEAKRTAVTEFILRICILERYIEIKRQTLCNKEDFQPYVAFMRINRDSGHSITPSMIHKFLADNLLEVSLRRCQIFVEHYDADKDGVLSYKEFIEVLLPKEHPELRAYVAQQECFVISKDEYLSYETECCLAALLEREVYFFDDSLEQKLHMTDESLLSPSKIMELVDSTHGQNFNFTNLQQFFNKIGLLPYDAEIINFLRRTDKDDDGVVNLPELEYFLSLYDDQREPLTSSQRQIKGTTSRGVSEEKLRRASPNRKIVDLKNRQAEDLTLRQSALGEGPLRASHSRADLPAQAKHEGLSATLASSRASMKSNLGQSSGLQGPQQPATGTRTYIEERASNRRTELQQRPARQPEAAQDSYRLQQESQPVHKATPTRSAQRDSSARQPGAPTDTERSGQQRERSSLARDRPVREAGARDSGDTDRQRLGREPDRDRRDRERESDRERPSRETDRLHERPTATDRPVSDRGTAADLRKTPSKPVYAPIQRDSSNSRLSGLQLREETAKPPQHSDETFGNNSNYESAEQKMQNIFKQDSHRSSDLKRSHAPAFGTADRFKHNETPQSAPLNSLAKSHTRLEHLQPSDKKESAKQPVQAGLEERCSEAIYKAFKLILNQERNLELARRELVTKNDFDVSQVFSKIDKRNRSWFTIEDFRLFLAEIGLKNIDNRALMDLYSSYDVNQNCLLNFDQLVDMVCPADNKFAMYLNKSDKRVALAHPGAQRNDLRAARRRLQQTVQSAQKPPRCQAPHQARKPRPEHHLRHHRRRQQRLHRLLRRNRQSPRSPLSSASTKSCKKTRTQTS